MPSYLVALLAFAGWTVLLVASVFTWRGVVILFKGAAWNSFPSGIQHGSDIYWRFNRAHVNAVENLPLFIVVVVTALHLQAREPILDTLAWTVVGARVLQSMAHVSSGASWAVGVRFTFYFVQLVALGGMAWVVLG